MQFDQLRRRAFITLLSGAAAWPLAARAQQAAMPVVGFLHIASLETRREQVASFYRGLKDSGYIEGQNVAIQYRWAENQNDRLPALATDLVRHQVDVIAALSTPSVLAVPADRSRNPRGAGCGACSRPGAAYRKRD